MRRSLCLKLGLGVFMFAQFAQATLCAADRPNILWIVSEDNSAHYMPAYGDKTSKTPNLDRLAEQGNTFMYAYSNGAVCAVARSTILTGVYAPTLGSQNMRSRYPKPDSFKSYAEYLRAAGYYCTNNAKTDYNMQMKDGSIWDECSGKAHYKNRPDKSQPFMAVFNLGTTHESCLFEQKIKKARKSGVIPSSPSNDPDSVSVQPYLPPTPEIKNDIALYYDYITAMDAEVGKLIDELIASDPEAAKNTIIFYYSDHGGVLPREKRSLQDTGTHVPLIIYIPEKWKHLNPFVDEKRVESRTVQFVDFAPTVLSIAGLEKPANMQGNAFLGKFAQAQSDKTAFAYGNRYGEQTFFMRAVMDGEYRYVRNFYGFERPLVYCDYAFGQAGWRSWRAEYENGSLSPESRYWWEPQGCNFLYRTAQDPFEVNNLAHDAAYAKKLGAMQEKLKNFMLAGKDLGIIPEAKYEEILEKHATVYDFARSADFNYAKVFDAAWLASAGDKSALNVLKSMTQDNDPYVRYWAGIGLLNLRASNVKEEAEALCADADPMNKAVGLMLKARNLNQREAAIKDLASLLNFEAGAQANAFRTWVIDNIENLKAPQDLLAALKTKNAETIKNSKKVYTSN